MGAAVVMAVLLASGAICMTEFIGEPADVGRICVINIDANVVTQSQ